MTKRSRAARTRVSRSRAGRRPGDRAFAAALALALCTAGREGRPASASPLPAEPPEAAPPAGAAAPPADDRGAEPSLAQTLEDALARRRERGDLRLEAECLTEGEGHRSVRVFGRGVGIWDGAVELRLGDERIDALLGALVELGFPNLADSYGGWPKGEPPAVIKEPPHAVQITCRVEVELGGRRKQSVQQAVGEQSPELRRLATRILEICEEATRSGRRAPDLAAGLRAVAEGGLAPETLQATVQHKGEAAGAAGELGWLVQVEGLAATARTIGPEGGYSEPFRLELTPEGVADLARTLAAAGFPELPINLHAPGVTDLSASVLDRRRSIQARPFAGLDPEAHEQERARLGRILERFAELHRSAVKGRASRSSTTGPAVCRRPSE